MTTSTSTPFLTPVMRMVQGNPFEKQTKDQLGNPLTIKTGPQAGQPTQRYFLAGAIRKDDPAWPAFWRLLQGAAMAGFPSLFNPQTGECLSRDFSFKVADGDSTMISKPGETPNAQKPGFAGHWIVKFSSSFAPKVFYAGHYAPHEEITDPKVLQRGYYVRVSGSTQANGNPQKPGIYVNLNMVEFAGVGDVIATGPDANAAFGGTAAQLPQGAQPLPMHAGNPQPGFAAPGMQPPAMGMPMQPQPQYAPPAMQQQAPAMPTFAPPAAGMGMPAFAPPAVASVPVQPHPGILAGPGMTPPPGMQPQAPATGLPPPFMPQQPQAPQMTAKAGGYTYEQYRQQGYTDDVLRANGLML